jgi:hypothetical protein
MSLSKNVKESLKEAESSIRNALYWASKNEKPFVCKQIADILHATEVIEHTENLLDKLENRKSGDSGMFGSFFTDM